MRHREHSAAIQLTKKQGYDWIATSSLRFSSQ
jgi:hypothetical protein